MSCVYGGKLKSAVQQWVALIIKESGDLFDGRPIGPEEVLRQAALYRDTALNQARKYQSIIDEMQACSQAQAQAQAPEREAGSRSQLGECSAGRNCAPLRFQSPDNPGLKLVHRR